MGDRLWVGCAVRCTGGKLSRVGAQREVVGRHAELEQVRAWLDRVPDGLQACVLTGPAGMGKTTVWQEGLELARAGAFLVLSARPGGAEVRLSYAGLADVLAPVEAERFELLPGVQRHALDVALLRTEAGEGGVDARAVAGGVLSLLRDLSTAAPVIVAVDDAQWLDAPTGAALSYALRRLGAAPVGVLASIRGDDGALPETLVAAVPAERRLELALPPLSVASIHTIVRERLGRVPPRPTLAKIVAASGGNPFYALEIVRELERRGAGAPAVGLPVPRDLGVLVRARLGRLPRATREALLTTACLATPRAELVDEEALGPAEERGIVRVAADGRVEFTHPLLASAVYESASTARRRTVHRRLAELVTGVEERARHLALASTGPDVGVARELDTAARLASARGAPAEAAELAELALRLAPEDTAARPELLLAAAVYQFHAGDLARAQAQLEQATALASNGPLRARALRLLGQLHARRSSFAEAIEAELAARDLAGADDELSAEIELDLAFFSSNMGDFAGGDTHARAAVCRAEAVGVNGLLASALAVQTVAAFASGRGLAEADLSRALVLEDESREMPLVLRPRFVYSFLMLCTGRLDDSLAALDLLRCEALERGRESDVPLVFLYLVWALVWRGDLDRAARFAAEARQTAALLDDRVADALALSASALAYAYTGEVERARVDSEAAIRHFEHLQWHGGAIWARWARGLLELSLGNPIGAYENLRPLTDLTAVRGPVDPALMLFVPDEVDALVQLGRIVDARSLLEPFQESARSVDRAWALAAAARCRGLIEAAGGDLEGALATFEEALRHHDAEAMPLERARTLLELGRLQRRRKQKRSAQQAFDEALAVFGSLGARLWAEKARVELARVATRTAQRGLTATEERIARLAAEGLSNRAIAEQAFVSVKTVETNLKRAYRKLGISSRAQLARALDRRDAQAIS